MKYTSYTRLVVCMLLLGMVSCGRSGPLATPTPNTQATIDAAVVATMTAQAHRGQPPPGEPARLLRLGGTGRAHRRQPCR